MDNKQEIEIIKALARLEGTVVAEMKHVHEKLSSLDKNSASKSEMLIHRWLMGGMCVSIFYLYVGAKI